MASSNTNIQVSDLDFASIKNNFITYLQSQTVFKDYNFTGSTLSTLLDILAYNTQYNAYYLNMVANEMFLDSAIQRGSVVSLAKLLNYTPKSSIAPTATINLIGTTTNSSVTIPKFANFMSEAIGGVNYNFVTEDSYTVNASNGTVTFNNENVILLKQGVPTTYAFTVNSTSNPNYIFEIPDANIDTTSIQVAVQVSSSNTSFTVFQPDSSYLTLTGLDPVYFLQESVSGNYQIYFGNGILGQQLLDGNIINVSYISTQGTAAQGANNFVLMDNITGLSGVIITPQTPATNGAGKEGIDSIKFQAPKSFSAQGRAVTKNDYITAIQQNTLGFGFDAVNVWGGEELATPVFGQVFISMKPTGSYNLTTTQKQQIISQIIKPISVLTVSPTIVDPDYTYINISTNVLYNPTKTTRSSASLQTGITNAIYNFSSTSLNTFNSTFSAFDLLDTIQTYDASVITSEYSIKLSKKFLPTFYVATNYTLNYNTPLNRGIFSSSVSSYPSMQFQDPNNPSYIINDVNIEEVPTQTNGIDSLTILNPGYSYQYAPTITIQGDGTGATAVATIINGSIISVKVTNAGTGYTSAIAIVTPQTNDTTGALGAVSVNIQGQYGTLRTVYNINGIKTVLNANAGTIDYVNGIIKLISFNPISIPTNPLGQLTITATPQTTIISSTYNGILTVDPFDPTDVIVNVIAKTS